MVKLVPPSPPSPKQAVFERIKKMPRPPGLLQCNRCGCRSSLTIRNGDRVVNGRIMPGTVIAKHICANCYKSDGLEVSMLPELKRVE